MSAGVRQCYEAEVLADRRCLTDDELWALRAAGIECVDLALGRVVLVMSLVSTSKASARRRVRRAMLDAVPDLDLSQLEVSVV